MKVKPLKKNTALVNNKPDLIYSYVENYTISEKIIYISHIFIEYFQKIYIYLSTKKTSTNAKNKIYTDQILC